jgi:3-oxoadipate enol-lactonase
MREAEMIPLQGMAPVAGTHLAYEAAGDGPCLVLIPGFTLDMRMWDDQLDALAGQYRVVRYDMRGFGRSPMPEEMPYRDAADLLALLAHLGIERATILGLSYGAGVALDFALSYPDAVRALILVSSAVGGWTWSAAWSAQAGPVWTAARELGIAAARERWLALPLFGPAREQPTVASRLREMVTDYPGGHWVHDPQEYLQPPALERLGEIGAPTLVVIGERDEPDFKAMAAALEQGIAGSRRVVLPGVGHMLNMEDPEQFNGLILRFLAEGWQHIDASIDRG